METMLRNVLPDQELLRFYEQMFVSREFEERCAEQYAKGRITGFLHLYSGQEAVAVGATAGLRRDDYILSAYREHAQAIVRGVEPRRVMAELFGRATGVCKGKGGSMHLFDPSVNFMGGYAIVGGQFPIAVGLAFAARYRGEERIAACFFGVVIEECWRTCGLGGEIASRIYENCFDILKAPVKRVSGLDVPMPYSRKIEKLCIPQVETIRQAVTDVMSASY